MTTAEVSFKALLKDRGYSITKARVAVFRALTAGPISMHGLIEQTRVVDRASVYRAIELFEQLGMVQRVNTGWKYKLELTDIFAEHHHHLHCTNCGQTVDIEEAELEAVIDRLAARYLFKPTAHQIEIQGICDNCRDSS